MKILYLVPDTGIPVRGSKGASAHVRALSEALAEIGQEITVAATDIGGSEPIAKEVQLVSISSSDSVEALASTSLAHKRELRSLFRNVDAHQSLTKLIQSIQPDVILERLSLFSIAGLAVANASKIPYLLEVDAPLSQEAAQYRGLELQETARLFERTLVSMADAVLPVSTALRDWAVSQGASSQRVHIIPNGVNTRQFDPALAKDKRKELGLEGAEVVGFVGGFRPWHGINLIMKAFNLLVERNQDARLLLVGDGPARASVDDWLKRDSLADRVLVTGHVPHTQVPDFLATIDVVLAPYEDIPNFYFSPLKILESMAMGRPTVASAAGDIPELMMGGKAGILVPPGDANALATSAERLLRDTKLAAELGEAARECAVNYHDWQSVAARIVEYAHTTRGDSG